MKWHSGELYGQPQETRPAKSVEREATCPTELVNEHNNPLTNVLAGLIKRKSKGRGKKTEGTK